jgi:hypothetical protein
MAGTSYTRQSTFTDGDTITASLFNIEYDQLVSAFTYTTSGTTGHQHDGGAGQGGNIEIIGDTEFKNKIVVDSSNNRWSVFVDVGGSAVEQVRIEDGVVYPVTDSDVDLGTDALRFKNAYIDSLTATGNLTVGGDITVTGTTAVKMPAGTTAQRPTGVAGQFRYNTTQGKFEGYTTEWGEIGGGSADLLLNQFTGDGSNVTFTLSGGTVENNTLVYLDGVYQSKSNYTVSSATPAILTFSTAPPSGAAIEVMVSAISVSDIGTPSDGTVTTPKIVDGAITTAKLAAGVGGAFNDFSIKTADYTAVTRDQLIVNSASARTITLPASPVAGNIVFIKNAGAGTVTVARNGSNINSTADNGELTTDAGTSLVFCDSTIGWKEL